MCPILLAMTVPCGAKRSQNCKNQLQGWMIAKIMGTKFRHGRSVRNQMPAKLQKSVAWVDTKTTAKIMGKHFRHDRLVRGQALAKLQKSVAWMDAKTTAKFFLFRIFFVLRYPKNLHPVFRISFALR